MVKTTPCKLNGLEVLMLLVVFNLGFLQSPDLGQMPDAARVRQDARRECCKSCDLGPELENVVTETPERFLFEG